MMATTEDARTNSAHAIQSWVAAKTADAQPDVDAPAFSIEAASLGDPAFRADYNIKYAYLAGSMYKGIASKELVVTLGKSGFMGYLGTGGMDLDEVEAAIRHIQSELKHGEPHGMNLLCNLMEPELENKTVDLYLRYGIRRIEASAFMRMRPALVKYRLKGIKRSGNGTIEAHNRILAKVSRPEVAAAFMEPAPEAIVAKLLASGEISAVEAELGRSIPVAEEICVEADSGGHTDQGVAYALMPAMLSLRNEIAKRYAYPRPIRIGAAGGIGTPEAAAAAFVMGADFVLTGSVNQCTVEAGTSDAVKDLLQQINVQDTAYAPAGDMFEIGAKVQVLKRGVFFPARANKLYELYQRHASLAEIDENTRNQIQEKYFKRTFDDVWAETKSYYQKKFPQRIGEIESNPKQKMALIFKWYFVHSTRLALNGSEDQRVDYQVHTGPALGAFNQWVKGTSLEDWRNRRVADIGERIMRGAAEVLSRRLANWISKPPEFAQHQQAAPSYHAPV